MAVEVEMAAETDGATEVVVDGEGGEDLVGLEDLVDLLEELEVLGLMALMETVLGMDLEGVEEMEEGRGGEAEVGV